MPEDLALRLLRQGYAALPMSLPRSLVTDSYPARMLGRPALVLRGESGARLFYDTSAVRRRRAMPRPLADLLFGRGAVHGLDDEEHTRRKRLFLDVVAEAEVDALADQVHDELSRRVSSWSARDRVVVFDELVQVYGRAVLSWSGVQLPDEQAAATSRDLATIVDGFGGAGTAYVRAWAARHRSQRWAAAQVRAVREGTQPARPNGALALVAAAPLDDTTAAVELLNVVRPTVAVSWLGTFAALAVDENPDWVPRLRTDPAVREAFAQEVRRHYPFVPALAGRTRRPLTWEGHEITKGTRLVLDVRGVDTDPRTFPHPHVFDPGRFERSMPGPYEFLPQGGGHPETGHRCPGERMTMRLLDVTLEVLARTRFEVLSPHRVPVRRIPTRPEGGLVVRVLESHDPEPRRRATAVREE
jgi:fatty-acid peroxygenase